MIRLNGYEIKPTIFPDGTSQVWQIPKTIIASKGNKINWDFESEAELIHLAQLVELLYHEVGDYAPYLTLSYLPYGRQDKVTSNDATFALRTFCKILKDFSFREITCMDPHSDVASTYLHNFHPIYPQRQVWEAYQKTNSDMVCYPDKGASTKYSKVYDFFPVVTRGEKVRDQSTGNITSYQVFGNFVGKNVLIVDDICDGGMTFKILAKDLLAGGAKEVNLFVTHGIFSKGLKTLHESGIKRVFTQDGEKSE